MTKTKPKPKLEHKHQLFHLAEPERILWQKVTATIRPLSPERRNQDAKPTEFLDAAMMKEMFGAGDTAPLIASPSLKKSQRPETPSHKKFPLDKLEHFPKSGNRFWDKKCGKNKELEQISDSIKSHSALERPIKPSETKTALAVVVSPISSRKEQRKIARQRFDERSRLDLHGASQDKAYDFLLHFIRANFARNQSFVLVITGKGQRQGGVGILRQLVPQWLETPPFRLYVSAVEVAARHHGGEGAFYVKLRRNLSVNI